MDEFPQDSARARFLVRFRQNWPTPHWQDVTVVAAVSGGADSMAMLRALVAVHPNPSTRLMVAHINHRLRGDESDADEAFVRNVCETLSIPCQVAHMAAGACSHPKGRGFEAIARQARYDCLTKIAESHGARYIATAHTADDQVETVLHRILRGTGLHGLTGIPRARALNPFMSLIRPVLPFTRSELREFLAELGQAFREDSTNRSRRFTRNRLRHELIPHLIQRYNPRVDQALLRLAGLASETQAVLDQLVDELAKACVVQLGPSRIQIDCERLDRAKPLLKRNLLIHLWTTQGWPLRDMGLPQWQQMSEMTQSPLPSTTSITFPGGVQAERRGHLLLLRAVPKV
jgi:tRNA(Ile)-lysidine synthase